jgi:hypothetical protein
MQIVSSMFENPGYQATKAMLDVATVRSPAW